MTEPKKHHFLPQFYLEQFKIMPKLGKYPQIWQIEKSATLKPIKSAIKDTGCVTDYHTLDFQDKRKDRNSIETILSRLESKQAELVEKVCDSNQISKDAKPHLADFISTMRYRVPDFKEYIEKSLEGLVHNTFKILMYKQKLPPPPKELEELFQKQGYDCIKPKIFNWKILQFMLDMAFGSENSSFFREMKWKLILTPPQCNFITGDSPVSIYHPYHEVFKHHGAGLAFKDIEVTFPLSKKLLIKLTWDGRDESIQASEDQVAEYNRRTIIMAKKYIFTSEYNQYLEEQIVRFHGIRAGYQLDNIWYGDGALQITRFIPITN